MTKGYRLRLLDRFAILALLPVRGSYTEMLIAEDLRRRFNPTPGEIDKYKITDTAAGVRWNDDGEAPVLFDIEQPAAELVAQLLARADAEQKLSRDAVGAYRLFVIGEPSPREGA